MKMKLETLKQATLDWSDAHYTQMAVAISLGLMTAETNYQMEAKHVFWSKHSIGDMLRDFVDRLVEVGVLEHKETEYDDEYRWNPAFRGSWEKTISN